MVWRTRILCLWPGLARLWLRGDFYSLALAVSFSVLLNLAIISSLIWPAYLGSNFPVLAWPLLIAVWVIGFFVSWRSLPQMMQIGRPNARSIEGGDDTLFIHAQREYLRGNFLEASTMLEHRLRFRPRDVESRMLLVSVMRRTGRLDRAIEHLELLGGFDEARIWRFEIVRERKLIESELFRPSEEEAVSVRELHQQGESRRLPSDPSQTNADLPAQESVEQSLRRAA